MLGELLSTRARICVVEASKMFLIINYVTTRMMIMMYFYVCNNYLFTFYIFIDLFIHVHIYLSATLHISWCVHIFICVIYKQFFVSYFLSLIIIILFHPFPFFLIFFSFSFLILVSFLVIFFISVYTIQTISN